MNLQKWEATIQKMTEEFRRTTKESGQNLVLTEWRKLLAKEPQLLQPFQIDEIVREVRPLILRRLGIPKSRSEPLPKPLFMCATTQAMLFLVRHLESGLDLT